MSDGVVLNVNSICEAISSLSIVHDGNADFSFLRVSSLDLFISCCSSHSSFIVNCILPRLLSQADDASRSTSQILFTANSIKRVLIMIRDCEVPLSEEISDEVLLYVFKFWDFVVDVVSYDCIDSFGFVLDIHRQHCTKCKSSQHCEWFSSVAYRVFSTLSRCKAVYKCMLSLLLSRGSLCTPFITPHFISSLYSGLSDTSVGVALTEVICECLTTGYGTWDEHVTALSTVCIRSSSHSGIHERLLPALSRNARIGARFLKLLIETLNVHSPLPLEALLSVSRFAVSARAEGGNALTWHDLVSQETLTRAIVHSDEKVRFSAWSLLIEHPRKTEPFSIVDCSLIGVFLETSMGEQRPAVRMKILAGLKKAVIRIVEVSERFLSPSIERNDEQEAMLKSYIQLIYNVIELAFDSLVPEANFPRRMMALGILDLFYRQKVHIVEKKSRLLNLLNVSTPLTQSGRISSLVSLLDDCYEFCQSQSLTILVSIHKDTSLSSSLLDIPSLRSSTLSLLLSLSTHITAAAGYRIRFLMTVDREETQSLLSSWFIPRLESRLSSASSAMHSLIEDPLHPILNALQLVLHEMSLDASPVFHLIPSIVSLLHRISSLVSPIVHNLSPEGYLPPDFVLSSHSLSSPPTTTPSQLLLACAWRAHKHVSSILEWAVKNLPYPSVLTPSLLRETADYFWLQLTECKHCGAFEGAVEGFETVCTRLWSLNGEERLPRPEEWLKDILEAIDNEDGGISSLCVTRRSAGLPHLVTCILVTEPQERHSQSLLNTMGVLLEMEGRSVQSRVHSFNVSKAIINCSRLSEKMQPGLELSLLTCISGCSSPDWPVRNASSQLLAALVSRVFGVPREGHKDLRPHLHNTMSAAEFFARFPSLADFLLITLMDNSCTQKEFSLFPSLIILTHLFPSSASPLALAPFVPRILKVVLSARAEKVRALGVAALDAVSTREDVAILLTWIEKIQWKDLKQNHIHAILLILKSWLDRKKDEDYQEIERRVKGNVETIVREGNVREWCDWNVNVVLLLLLRLSLPLHPSILPSFSSLTLSLRPIATTWLQQKELRTQISLECSSLLRHEVYRVLLQSGELMEEMEMEGLVERMTRDLNNSNKESDRLLILHLLLLVLKSEGMHKGKKKIVECVKDLQVKCRLVEESLVRVLRLQCGLPVQEGDIEWLQRCTESDDDNTKILVIGAIGEKPLSDEEAAIDALYEFLQDEDSEIRQLSSVVLSERIYGEGSRMNAFILRLARDEKGRGDEKGIEEEERQTSGMALFEASVANPYAESKLIGKCSYSRELLESIQNVPSC